MVPKVIYSSKIFFFLNQSCPSLDMEEYLYSGVDRERHLTSQTTTKSVIPEGKQAPRISVYSPLWYPQPQVSSRWRDTKRVHGCKDKCTSLVLGDNQPQGLSQHPEHQILTGVGQRGMCTSSAFYPSNGTVFLHFLLLYDSSQEEVSCKWAVAIGPSDAWGHSG